MQDVLSTQYAAKVGPFILVPTNCSVQRHLIIGHVDWNFGKDFLRGPRKEEGQEQYVEGETTFRVLLSSEFGTCTAVKARLWPFLAGWSP